MALRAITFSTLRTHSEPLFQRFKLLDVVRLHKFSVLTFMYDLCNGTFPHPLYEYCQIVHHTYRTRTNEKRMLYLPKFRTTQGQFSISYLGPKLWNTLPREMREQSKRSTFRKCLVDFLL